MVNQKLQEKVVGEEIKKLIKEIKKLVSALKSNSGDESVLLDLMIAFMDLTWQRIKFNYFVGDDELKEILSDVYAGLEQQELSYEFYKKVHLSKWVELLKKFREYKKNVAGPLQEKKLKLEFKKLVLLYFKEHQMPGFESLIAGLLEEFNIIDTTKPTPLHFNAATALPLSIEPESNSVIALSGFEEEVLRAEVLSRKELQEEIIKIELSLEEVSKRIEIAQLEKQEKENQVMHEDVQRARTELKIILLEIKRYELICKLSKAPQEKIKESLLEIVKISKEILKLQAKVDPATAIFSEQAEISLLQQGVLLERIEQIKEQLEAEDRADLIVLLEEIEKVVKQEEITVTTIENIVQQQYQRRALQMLG
ncbi:MAG: hypothetical protein JSV34_07075, partial [Candidatus Omnitrophota bacterium]